MKESTIQASVPAQLCTMRIDGVTFGVEVQRVQEVIRSQPMTSVPRADDIVRGLINLRGQIVTAIDLRTRLDIPRRVDDGPLMNVVVRTDDGPVSLLVDEIGDVITVAELEVERPPETLPPRIASAIGGVLKLPQTLLLMLDIDRVIDVDLPGGGHADAA